MTNEFYPADLIGIFPSPKFIDAAIRALDMPSIHPSENYKVATKLPPNPKTFKDLSAMLEKAVNPKTKEEFFLKPTNVFDKGKITDNGNGKVVYISLGIFNLDPSSAKVKVTRLNNVEVTWAERAGKGRFVNTIPSYLVVTSAPVLCYEGGVLDIQIPVKLKEDNDITFVGKLVTA